MSSDTIDSSREEKIKGQGRRSEKNKRQLVIRDSCLRKKWQFLPRLSARDWRTHAHCPIARPPNSSLSTVNHPINIYILSPLRQLFWLHHLPAKILYMLSTSLSSSPLYIYICVPKCTFLHYVLCSTKHVSCIVSISSFIFKIKIIIFLIFPKRYFQIT